MKNYEPRRCDICGREYIPKRSDQRCCLDPECRKGLQRLNYREYRQKNYAAVLETNRRCMAKRREEKRRKEAQGRDGIVAIGYAERQREKTLAMVGKVKVTL